jgi:GT2 family glycosyltransferase
MSLVSVLTSVGDTDPDLLDAAVRSVLDQTYGGWQLCLVEDGTTSDAARAALAAWEGRDHRITTCRPAGPIGAAAAHNRALAVARGDLVTVLAPTDLLHHDALGALNHTFTKNPLADVVYTDEDTLSLTGEPGDHPVRKPGWSPEYLTSCMYLGRLTAYRTSLVRALGGFEAGAEGVHEWDLALRATQVARQVHHLARVLYHRRPVPGGGAGPDPVPAAQVRRVLEAHLARRGLGSTVEESALPGGFVTRPGSAEASPAVTVVVPTAGSFAEDGATTFRLVDRCLEGVLTRTDYGPVDVVVVVSENAPAGLEEVLVERHGPRVRTHRMDNRFNYSESINRGVLASDAPYLLLLNDDTEPLDRDWLQRLVDAASDPEVGVVGAKLLYPDGTVQHAGVMHDVAGMPYHPHAGLPDGPGYVGDQALTLNYLAVTGACQMVRREVFEQAGGYDPSFPLNFNDIDFCLRVHACGYRVVQLNAARLVHRESATRARGMQPHEQEQFQDRWRSTTERDPFRHPVLADPSSRTDL